MDMFDWQLEKRDRQLLEGKQLAEQHKIKVSSPSDYWKGFHPLTEGGH
eukprot:SAG11_NODE_678_length_7786_cov_10.991804_3_plen_48_part_00